MPYFQFSEINLIFRSPDGRVKKSLFFRQYGGKKLEESVKSIGTQKSLSVEDMTNLYLDPSYSCKVDLSIECNWNPPSVGTHWQWKFSNFSRRPKFNRHRTTETRMEMNVGFVPRFALSLQRNRAAILL